VSCAKTAEPIDLLFGLWTRVDRKKQKFNRIRQVARMCPHIGATWRIRHLGIESSVCSRDAALRQITLTTCYKRSAAYAVGLCLTVRLSVCLSVGRTLVLYRND